MKIHVGNLSEIPVGGQKTVRVGRQSVLIINDGGTLYALRNMCTHDSVALEGGPVCDGKITCLAHGATLELATGKATAPAFKAVRLYRVWLEGDEVWLEE